MATTNKETTVIDTAAKKVLGLTKKVNDFALDTTEKVAMKSIDLAEKGLDYSTKMVKKGLDTSAKNQDLVFNALENVKVKVEKFIPKFK